MTAHLSLSALDNAPPPDIREALTRARRLISHRVGVIAEVAYIEMTPEDPAVFWAQSIPAELAPLGGSALNEGSATSVDPDRAIMKAVGESVERYCSGLYDESEFTLATYDELTAPALRPEDFALFSPSQYGTAGFPFAPFTRHTPVRWTRGHSLLDDRETWVPAGFVYIPYTLGPSEPPLKDLISTGLACGPTLANALLKAVAELVERDAYMIVWQNRLPRPHIDLERVGDPLIARLVAAFKRLAVRVHVVLLSLDMPITVVLVVMTRSDGPPWTVVASGADLSPRHALRLALEEAGLALAGMTRWFAADSEYRASADYMDVTTMQLHGLAHAADPRLRAAAAFLTRPSEVVHLDDLQDPATGNPTRDLRTVLTAMRPFVSDVVGVDVTTSDIDEVGFKVVRVIVPEMQSMDMDHRSRHLGGRRLYEVPWKLGLVGAPRTEADMNPDPHPFP